MELYLLRHGIAEDGKPGGRDADRALTDEGAKRLKQTLKRAREAGMSPKLIISSPYLRAMQTAEQAKEVLGYEGKIVKSRALEPGSTPEAAWQEIRAHHDESQVLLTGHEPLFGQLTAYVLGVPELLVDFKKGALVRVDLDASRLRARGVLKWMITSRLA